MYRHFAKITGILVQGYWSCEKGERSIFGDDAICSGGNAFGAESVNMFRVTFVSHALCVSASCLNRKREPDEAGAGGEKITYGGSD